MPPAAPPAVDCASDEAAAARRAALGRLLRVAALLLERSGTAGAVSRAWLDRELQRNGL